MYTLRQAATATGKTKQAITKAVQAGKLSASKDTHGCWLLDPAEVHRVYPPVTTPLKEEPTNTDSEIALRERLAAKDELIATQATTIESLENVISDLMARLDQEATDRRRAYAQLTGLLTDQRKPVEKKRWWLW